MHDFKKDLKGFLYPPDFADVYNVYECDKFACGPNSLNSKLNIKAGKFFNISCLIHDFEYRYPKKSGCDRYKSDFRFLKNMLYQSSKEKNFLKRSGREIQAYTFFCMVFVGGWIFYEKT